MSAISMTGFGRGVYKSADGGASWALKNNGLPSHEPFAWRLAQSGDGTLYRSRDGADSWEKVPLPELLNCTC